MIVTAIEEAQQHGARLRSCCRIAGVDDRTVQRWLNSRAGEDQRRGPRTVPHNRLSDKERQEVIRVATSSEYRDLSPKQIVPRLADSGRYVASESTMYRVLREQDLVAHRGRQKPREPRSLQEHAATGPNQVWSWDITYLRSPIRGAFFYLYLIVDVWSRKIVAARVHEEENGDLASRLVVNAIDAEGATAKLLVLHQDNGGPMKGATLKATLEALGVHASYSRPRVSDDNAFSEALFRTLKYRPEYPHKPFQSLEHAERWLTNFVIWYNTVHLHSAIAFVTPYQRHHGQDTKTLARRRVVYETARRRHPERWSGSVRDWSSPQTVFLNPTKQTKISMTTAHAA